MRIVCLLFVFLLINGCNDDLCRYHPEAELPEVEIEVNRLEKELFKAKEVSEVEKFLQSHEQMAARMFHLNEYPNEKILAERIFGLVQNDFIDTLYAEANEAFDQPLFEETMNTSLGWLKHYFPEMTVPKIQTMVSGLYNDLAISKSVIIIGLDFFIGEKASYRPKEVPQYILRRYEPKYMTPTVLKFFISDYCSSGDEETLLSEMIDYGKVYYLLGSIMPCTPDDLILGFTSKEILDVYAYQELIWSRIIEKEWLYVTDEFTKKKMLGERPNTIELGDECPGRVGAWIGWQIVKHYMDQTGSTMQELMANRNHHQIFAQSKYKPKNRR
jgi:hypothetical protein